MKRCIIIGAGVAGLTLAYYLCKAGCKVTVIEKEEEIGGLARTFHYGNWHFDIGPHRFYTANQMVLDFIQEIQSDDFLEIPRFSSVYYLNHYHDWPLRLGTITKLPPTVAIKAGIDLLLKQKQNSDDSFKSYVLKRYGKTLYQTFFHDYTEKFVGITTENTHKNWAKVGVERATIDETVNTASLMDIFKLMLMPKPAELNFWYPKFGGIQTFWNRCAAAVCQMGGEIITGSTPKSLTCEGDKIVSLTYGKTASPQGEATLECSDLIWSGTIGNLAEMLHLEPVSLTYRSLLVYNIQLKTPPLVNFQWCYYGDKDLFFARLSNPSNFSPHTIPSQHGALCAEVACQEGSEVWNGPELYEERLINDLIKAKVISSRDQVGGIMAEKIPNAYPIYELRYQEKLKVFEDQVNKYSNVHLLGRTGKFWYNNMDHSIENAISTAKELLTAIPNKTELVLEILNSFQASANKARERAKSEGANSIA